MSRYSFGGQTGETRESIRRRQDTANRAMQAAFARTPSNLGEGIDHLGKSLVSALANYQVGQAQTELDKAQAKRRDELLAGVDAEGRAALGGLETDEIARFLASNHMRKTQPMTPHEKARIDAQLAGLDVAREGQRNSFNIAEMNNQSRAELAAASRGHAEGLQDDRQAHAASEAELDRQLKLMLAGLDDQGRPLPGAAARPEKKSDSQRRGELLVGKVGDAATTLGEVVSQPDFAGPGLVSKGAKEWWVPDAVNNLGDLVRNNWATQITGLDSALKRTDVKQMEQAYTDLISHALYMLSGAEAPDKEFVRNQVGIHMPTQGDPIEVRRQKAQSTMDLVARAYEFVGQEVPSDVQAALQANLAQYMPDSASAGATSQAGGQQTRRQALEQEAAQLRAQLAPQAAPAQPAAPAPLPGAPVEGAAPVVPGGYNPGPPSTRPAPLSPHHGFMDDEDELIRFLRQRAGQQQ